MNFTPYTLKMNNRILRTV